MRKILVLLVAVLSLNLSSAQENYKIKDSYKLAMAFGQLEKGTVTFVDKVLTVNFKDKAMGDDFVMDFNDLVNYSITQENDTKESYLLQMIDPQGLVRLTLVFVGDAGTFTIETKDAFTGKFYTSIISF